MVQPTAQRIPNFIKHRRPDGLRRLMLLNNTRNNTFYQYFSIQMSTDGYWYAWFFQDVEIKDISDFSKKGEAE